MTTSTAPVQHTEIDPKALRQAFGTFATGVTVITTSDQEGLPRGMTANSFTSVSLDPPLLLVCVAKAAASYQAFSESASFAVNVLHEEQLDVSNKFASKATDKFESVRHDKVHTGAPILTDSLTWFDCTTHNRVDAGDHIVLIGQIQAFGTSPKSPLCFNRGSYANLENPLPESWINSHGMVSAYLIESQDSILLRKDSQGGWSLPESPKQKDKFELVVANKSISLLPDKTFLYSIFDVEDKDPGYMVFRAHIADSETKDLPEGLEFFNVNGIPFDAMPSNELRAVVRRYVKERQDQKFSIYMGSSDGGRVAVIDGAAKTWADFTREQQL
ncbi:flavin reductase family protein [Pseudomonas gingeri]|uniref:flavin reductase family protein n=1 Tax=Pseudomonas gingeri TaxID=117681 RepID=UPI0015A252F4|nr:flavin reductase family protein [Pseudomonas gingeri]NWD07259.1 flavin reductase family protein [Pseudomonas gingeri]NWE35628.1 flavin reductase family protein [Pseudomonas gingeri]NWE60862.1 flavin reductase family protein [Pseudomonas gingeri]NWF02840.1 flavin reductase family protein [Pseudomonas gingeri]